MNAEISHSFMANTRQDEYKIVCFTTATAVYHIDGCHLDEAFVGNPHQPVDEVLRQYYHQVVLVNMKGAGAPVYEDDVVSDSDEAESAEMWETNDDTMVGERMQSQLARGCAAVGNWARDEDMFASDC